jgi:hypothetical protein
MSASSSVRKIPLFTLVCFGAALAPGLTLLFRIWTHVGEDGISLVTAKLPVVDFANLWSGGYLARHADLATLFDTDAYRAWLHVHFSPRYENSEWSYPPPMLLLGVPLSFLGIVPAYLVWVGGTAAALFATLRHAGLDRSIAIAVILSPAMLTNVIFGQNGALTAALLFTALLLAPARPVTAGIGAGLFILKPQLGILLPAVFLALRSWRAIAVAVTVAAGLGLLTAAAFGFDSWVLFWTRTRPLMVSVLEAPWPSGHLANGVTVFFMARAFGMALPIAYGLQGLATLCAAALAVRAWRNPAFDPALLAAFTVPLVFLATPYAYTYDLVALAVATAIVTAKRNWRFGPVTMLAWFWPGVSSLFGSIGWLLTPFVLAGFAAVVWRELRRASAQGPT